MKVSTWCLIRLFATMYVSITCAGRYLPHCRRNSGTCMVAVCLYKRAVWQEEDGSGREERLREVVSTAEKTAPKFLGMTGRLVMIDCVPSYGLGPRPRALRSVISTGKRRALHAALRAALRGNGPSSRRHLHSDGNTRPFLAHYYHSVMLRYRRHPFRARRHRS